MMIGSRKPVARLSSLCVAALLALPIGEARAGACSETWRYRDTAGDPTKIITSIVNNTSSPQLVQFGTQANDPGVHKGDVQTLQPGQTATFSKKIGSSANVLFVMYIKENVPGTTTQKEIMKCRYVVDNLRYGAQSAWKKWECPTLSKTLSYTCDKSFKPGKEQWVTKLTLK
jgi:hypothetical protein